MHLFQLKVRQWRRLRWLYHVNRKKNYQTLNVLDFFAAPQVCGIYNQDLKNNFGYTGLAENPPFL